LLLLTEGRPELNVKQGLRWLGSLPPEHGQGQGKQVTMPAYAGWQAESHIEIKDGFGVPFQVS
jgi:hypothetical protein